MGAESPESLYAAVNDRRSRAGLPELALQPPLQQAAQAHSDYMHRNRILDVRESSDNPGYTGDLPSDRVIRAGYRTRMIFESVSSSPTPVWERDRLLAAVYRRFGLLGMAYDEIGLGGEKGYYTYDLGNAQLNRLCQGPSYLGPDPSVTGICDDPAKRIRKSEIARARNRLRRSAPSILLWPPRNGRDIPPALYDESPDPLPDDSVSAFPVTVEFNPLDFPSPPETVDLTLENRAGEALESLTLLSADNDPTHRLTPYQFALLPKKRLEWGRNYYGILRYRTRGRIHQRKWCFSTRSLRGIAERYYRVEGGDETELSLLPGKRYAIYIVPENTGDLLGAARWTSHAKMDLRMIDPHTLLVTISGEPDEEAQIIFANGQKLNLIIATGDNAEIPEVENCFDDKSFVSAALPAGLREEEVEEPSAPAPGRESNTAGQTNATTGESLSDSTEHGPKREKRVERESSSEIGPSPEQNISREGNESNVTLLKPSDPRQGKPAVEDLPLPSEAEDYSLFAFPLFPVAILAILLYPILRLLIRRSS
jgi:hypothetical protein